MLAHPKSNLRPIVGNRHARVTCTKSRLSRRFTVSMSSTTLERSDSSCCLYCAVQHEGSETTCATSELQQISENFQHEQAIEAIEQDLGGCIQWLCTMSKTAWSLILSYESSLCFDWISCKQSVQVNRMLSQECSVNKCARLCYHRSGVRLTQLYNATREHERCSRTPIFLPSASIPVSELMSALSTACSTSAASQARQSHQSHAHYFCSKDANEQWNTPLHK
jgi:hypothetical protein